MNETYDYQEDEFIIGATKISLDEEVKGPWVLPLLLGRDVNGAGQQWQIGFDGIELVTRYGKIGGSLQTVRRRVITNTSGRDIYQQSLQEGKRRFMDKCLEGYCTEGSESSITIKPMLANDFKGNNIKDWQSIYYQPKLDGVRCLISNTVNGIAKMSRSNRHYSFLNHLDEQCRLLLSLLPTGTYLDGELYAHNVPFEKITSIVRKTKEPDADEAIIQYWIFDLLIEGSDATFDYRYSLLYQAYQQVADRLPHIVIVPLYQLNSANDILTTLDAWCDIGYEGLILRKTGPTSKYVMGRCSNILKVKKFITAEAVVTAVFPGSGTEESCAMFRLYDAEINAVFDVRPSGSFEQRAHWLLHPHEVLGKTYTYKCFYRKKGNLPRFPVGVGFRDYE